MDKIKQNSRLLYIPVFLVTVLPFAFGYPLGMGIKVIPIQILALAGAHMMFGCFSGNPLAVLLGVTLYMTAPYRIDLCYVQGNLLLSLVWALVPWYLWGLMKAREKGKRRILWMAFSACVLAGIGYGNSIMFFLLAALTLLAALVFKCAAMTVLVVGGAILWIPGNVSFLLALLTQRATEVVIPIKNIAPQGYVFNDFMTSYAYLEGRPGLGLGLLLAAAFYFYVRFVCDGAKLKSESRLFGTVGIFSLVLATRYFPWEFVQRLGAWALKLVSLIDTPALFVGVAALLLPVVFITAVDDLEEADSLPARGGLVFTWGIALWVASYLGYSLCSSIV